MSAELEKKIFDAYLHAAIQLGDEVKKMSCFLKNWGQNSPVANAQSNKKVV